MLVIQCLLSHMLYSGIGKDLMALRYALTKSDQELAQMLTSISNNSPSQVAKFLGARMAGVVKSEKTWASVCFTLTAATAWLANKEHATVVSGNGMLEQTLFLHLN